MTKLASLGSTLLGTALVLAVTLPPSRADACSPPQATSHVLVGAGATVPSNTKGIPVKISGRSQEKAPRLLTAAGDAIAATLVSPPTGSRSALAGESLVVPAAPLAAGDYRLEIPPDAEGEAPATATFAVGAAAASPVPGVTVTVGNARRARVTVGGGASCTDQFDASVVDVTVRVAEDYRPFKDLVVFEGRKSDPEAYFWTITDGVVFGPPAKGIGTSLSTTYPLARRCSDGAGTASIRFAARVRGLDGADAEASADLTFASCDALPEGKPTPGDEEPVPGGVAVGTPATPTAATETPIGASESGCTTAGIGLGSSGGAAFAALAMAASVLARRRRRAS